MKPKEVLLTKKELNFIRMATNSETGVYDFENTTSAEFKKNYKISKREVNSMLMALQTKIDRALNKNK